MQFIQHDLGRRNGGEIVEVTLSGQANVRLMDSGNFSTFKRGGRATFYGGKATRSPTRLTIPRSGHWYVVVDLGGYSGRIKSGVRVLSGLLKPISEAPLSDVPSLLRDDEEVSKQYDVFVSHASEDKEEVVRPLANALRKGGLTVWYDEFELKIGDSLRRKIDQGLANSRFGIVVFSRDFFSKGWTNYELDGLVTRAVSGEQVLLPIWHNVTKQEVISYSASLADKVARNTATHTPEEIAAEIITLIEEH